MGNVSVRISCIKPPQLNTNILRTFTLTSDEGAVHAPSNCNRANLA